VKIKELFLFSDVIITCVDYGIENLVSYRKVFVEKIPV
jgi:hypothetical protein